MSATLAVSDADICARIAAEIERSAEEGWLQEVVHEHIECLFGDWRKARETLRRLEGSGLVRRTGRASGPMRWTLTDGGFALASEGTVWCPWCAQRPALVPIRKETGYGRCLECAAQFFEDEVQRCAASVDTWRRWVKEQEDEAAEYREMLRTLREDGTLGVGGVTV